MTDQPTEQPGWIESIWSAPNTVRAGTSTRLYGYSQAPYHAMNIASHVGDQVEHITKNRIALSESLELPADPIWLNQTHGKRIVNLDKEDLSDRNADGIFTSQTNVVCGIMTADCLPLLITNNTGTEIAALHCGWRGLAAGIIEDALPLFSTPTESLHVWMGPAISARHYEIDDGVKAEFDHISTILQSDTFIPTQPGHWLVSLYRIAMLILKANGVECIYGGQYCTYRDQELFFSHRRDNGKTGRMVSLIWLEPNHE